MDMDDDDERRRAFDAVAWDRIGDVLRTHGMVRHQRESYEYFVSTLLPYIVSENSDCWSSHPDGKSKHCIHFRHLQLMKPSVQEFDGFEQEVTPNACRLRGLTYASNVMVEAVHDEIDTTEEEPKVVRRTLYPDLLLCRIPTMVNSTLCHLRTHSNGRATECTYDEGGYFIINGVERTLIAQEKLRTNMCYVFAAKEDDKGRQRLVGELRSCLETKMRSTSTLYVHATRAKGSTALTLTVTLPFVTLNVPLLYIFALLGVPAEGVSAMVLGDATGAPVELVHLVASVVDNAPAPKTREEILEYIGREGTKEGTKERRVKYVEHILMSEFIPHQTKERGAEADLERARFLGLLVHKICRVSLGLQSADDRDHYACKRVDSSGMLCSLLFRQLYRNHLKHITLHLHRLVDSGKVATANLASVLVDKRISAGFRYAFSTGTWGIQKTQSGQTGVAQVLGRQTATAAVSNMRRVNVPVNRDGKSVKPRQMHRTSFGIICSAETPEGGACGLVRHLALLTHVRLGCMSSPIFDLLARVEALTPVAEATPRHVARDACVFVNGRLHAYAPRPDVPALRDWLRTLRAAGDLPFDASLAVDGDGHLVITTDSGALLRPLARLDKLEAFCRRDLSFQDLLALGAIEYVDKQEEDNCVVALTIWEADFARHTHCELHAAAQHGLCAGLIPFANHNQAPRNVYQAAMSKQAVGMFALNFMQRMDSMAHVLLYPQRPLVATRVDDVLGVSNMPAAQNPVVAILCYTGFNQEDSIIVNRGALDNGLLRSMYLRTYKDHEDNTGIDAARFGRPPSTCGGLRAGNYDELDEHGMVAPGQTLGLGSAVIGKTMNMSDVEHNRRVVKRDRSTLVKSTEPQVVDAVYTSRNKDGHLLCRVRTRSLRVPQIGDKASSRHGQKGVISTILPPEDMPVTQDGIVPDLIINPHALPSRMTIAQLMETLLGKVCVQVAGKVGDGTPFSGVQVEDMTAELEARGYEPYGRETLLNGMTGEVLQADVFLGPVCYQRLKHMSIDKKHARGSNGPVQILTRQPTEGRSRDGGLRFGEMERDCLDEEHQILTNRGFLFLDEVLREHASGGLLAAGYEASTQRLVYEPILEVIVKPARTQTMVRVDGANVSLVVTPTHDLYVKPGTLGRRCNGDAVTHWPVAGRFEKRHAQDVAALGDIAKMVRAPARGVATATDALAPIATALGLNGREQRAAFLELYGFWLGDGSLQFKAGCGTDAVSFAQVKEGDVAFLLESMATLDVEHKVHRGQKQVVILLVDPRYVALFHGEYRGKYVLGDPALSRPSTVESRKRSRHEPLPAESSACKSAKWLFEWCYGLGKEDARAIIRGLHRADGCWKKPRNEIYTSSTSFRDELVRLCAHAGYAARFRMTYAKGTVRGAVAGKPVVATRDGWAVYFTEQDAVLHCKRDVTTTEYSGRTWCVSVGTTFIYTRPVQREEGEVVAAHYPVVAGNCLVSHGAAANLRERLYEQSDCFVVSLCKRCGFLCHGGSSSYLVRASAPYCTKCKTGEHVQRIGMPFATKLFMQELQCLNINPRLRLSAPKADDADTALTVDAAAPKE